MPRTFLPHIERLDDIRMAQRRYRTGFAVKSADGMMIGTGILRQQLERYLVLHVNVFTVQHHAHAAARQWSEHFVFADEESFIPPRIQLAPLILRDVSCLD